jgi:hypothetical protein
MYCVSCEIRTEFICYVEESKPPLWSSGQSSWLHNGNVSCFMWGTNWIYICYVEESTPPLRSSGQSFWLQIQRSWFDSGRYQLFWEVVGLERGPLSLLSTIEEGGLSVFNFRVRCLNSYLAPTQTRICITYCLQYTLNANSQFWRKQ